MTLLLYFLLAYWMWLYKSVSKAILTLGKS